jgi:hypothetical protein
MSAVAEALTRAAPGVPRPGRPWLVGPTFDLLLVANLAWPLVALLAYDYTSPAHATLSFLQVYLISTPHRWITLAVVFLDRDQFWARPGRFALIGSLLVGAGLGLVGVSAAVFGWDESLKLLMMADAVWNAWHFAAQHAGIARIYGRQARPDLSATAVDFERVALRLLVLWTFVRLFALYGVRRPEAGFGVLPPQTLGWLDWLDLLAATPATVVLVREMMAAATGVGGRLAYLGSVVTLYAATLAAVRWQSDAWLGPLVLASAVFHAVEYLAVVAWSARRRSGSVWAYVVPRLGLTVAAFMLVLMAANWFLASQSMYAWMLVTLLVSLLHYGYDGMIWKSRPAPRP